ncbi:hypothetical protein KC19_10G099200 [Ceratodon purpureus]|uniref:RING-type E3 ubiquitin transferase n=1 Tax=Ceratodon purpureus TaxID=3225 RepID=A0A8T0GIM8_CERPU|nr:hypothetical protein KC19_N033800 [Ceratodon purpureus]KAG0559366.1 hypothetical protein KC19_10G099200 [Ceratodon purpureus]
MGRILSDTSSGATLPFSNFTMDTKATTTAPTPPNNLTSQVAAETMRKGGNFNPTLAVVVGAMIISFFVVGFASGYLRRWIWGYEDETRHSELMRRRRLLNNIRNSGTHTKSQPGLDPEVVAAMPLVHFKDLPADQREGKYFDCPVCLAVFDPTDSLKLLPLCAHAFHSDCIDEWFRSHSTCPLCRVSLARSAHKSSSEGDANPSHSIRVTADFDVVDVEAVSGFESQAEIPNVGAPTAEASASEELQVHSRPILRSNTGGFPSFVPAIRVDIASAKAALATIRRSSSVGTNLQLLRHTGFVVDSEGTQHHRNSQVHATAIDDRGRSGPSTKVTGLPCSNCSRTCVWCTRRSFPNLRQIEPV